MSSASILSCSSNCIFNLYLCIFVYMTLCILFRALFWWRIWYTLYLTSWALINESCHALEALNYEQLNSLIASCCISPRFSLLLVSYVRVSIWFRSWSSAYLFNFFLPQPSLRWMPCLSHLLRFLMEVEYIRATSANSSCVGF